MLGQGGMGTVYMAKDLRLKGRSCVVKKLRDDFYRAEDRQKAREFFEREMEVLAELEGHANIVRLLDYFPEAGHFYLIMEYVQGDNLHVLLHQERGGEPFAEDMVIKCAQQICDVLIYLHEQHPPIIYRDLKPSNIMIDVKGEVKLVDFGIARRAHAGENTHVVSAGYSPPEQYWGSADVRSDIYSLGATMHFLLTARDPEALHVCSPRSINPNVSESLDRVIQKCTAQEAADRYQTAQDVWEALLHADCEPAPVSPRSRLWEAATGVVLLAVAAVIFFIQMPPGADNSPKPEKPPIPTHDMSAEKDEVPAPVTQTPVEKKRTTLSHDEETYPQRNADLAVQVMDEHDLTDPVGWPEKVNNANDKSSKPTKKKGFFFGLFGGN